MLTIAGLVHRFEGGAAALDIDQMTVGTGELTVIVGPSGSGKTTLLYVLSGLLRPSAGVVRWGDLDIGGLPEGQRDRWRRRHAGFVFQNFNLIEDMSPLANVTLAAHFSAWSDAGVRRRGRQLLEEFGVADEKRRVDTYSRGEQQRIALARALVFDPPIIFADEPTASLDTGNAQTMAAMLQGLARAGRTIIAVSHDPVLIGAADRVVRLSHGRLAAEEALS